MKIKLRQMLFLVLLASLLAFLRYLYKEQTAIKFQLNILLANSVPSANVHLGTRPAHALLKQNHIQAYLTRQYAKDRSTELSVYCNNTEQSSHPQLKKQPIYAQIKEQSAHAPLKKQSTHAPLKKQSTHAPLKKQYTHARLEKQSTHAPLEDKSESVHSQLTVEQGHNQIRVVIVAYGRSGSSFLSGIFNAHPDVFHIYEPLNIFVRHKPQDVLDETANTINNVVNCSVTDIFLRQFIESSHHRVSSRVLVSPPFCTTTRGEALSYNKKYLKLCEVVLTAQAVNHICRNYTHVVTKILMDRLHPADISWLWNMTYASQAHIVYLVRDPRAMFFSRFKLGWVAPRNRALHSLKSGEAENIIQKTCQTILRNIAGVTRHRSRVKLVRYEDLATNSEEVSRRLFSFVGIPAHDQVFKWLRQKSSGKLSNNVFSLSRPGKFVINTWRTKSPLQLVNIVEKKCSKVMRYFGYIPTNGSKALLNDNNNTLFHKHFFFD